MATTINLPELGEGVEVGVPVALSVEQCLVAGGPDPLDDRLERRPVDLIEVLVRDEWHAAPVHPETDRHLVVRIGRRQAYIDQMRDQRFGGRFGSHGAVRHQRRR